MKKAVMEAHKMMHGGDKVVTLTTCCIVKVCFVHFIRTIFERSINTDKAASYQSFSIEWCGRQ